MLSTTPPPPPPPPPLQTNRRDETRRVSTTKFPSTGVRGQVFASFCQFSVVSFLNDPRTPTDATKLENNKHVMLFDQNKTTGDEQKLAFETPHTSRRDETLLTPTSKNRSVSSR